jgi:shikimate kinase
MGSGKSTVGPLVAERLGWEFRDMDREVERRTGRPIPEIFRESGEAAFRAEEEQVARELRDRVVVASGGGWPCRPGRLETLPSGTFTVWLRVGPDAAVARIREGDEVRPLLQGPDPQGRARELLEDRVSYYRLAALHLDTEEAPPDELARRLVEWVEGDIRRPPRG